MTVFYHEPSITVRVYPRERLQLGIEPTTAANLRWVSIGFFSSGAPLMVGATASGQVLLRTPGYAHYATSIITHTRPTVLGDGSFYYIDATGVVRKVVVDETALKSGSNPIVSDTDTSWPIGGAYGFLGVTEQGDVVGLEYDDGGLRVWHSQRASYSPKRLYPNAAWRWDDFYAAVTGYQNTIVALATMEDGSVRQYVYRDGSWQHLRTPYQGDLSRLAVQGAFTRNGRVFVYGHYTRENEEDTTTDVVDYVLLEWIDGVIALYPFAALVPGASSADPFAVAADSTTLWLSTFNETGSIPIPPYVEPVDANAYDIPGEDVLAFSSSIEGFNGSFSARLRAAPIEQGVYSPNHWDAWRVTISDGASGVTEWYIVTHVVDSTRDVVHEYEVQGAPWALWLINNARLPNYVEIRGQDGIYTVTPGDKEALYSAPGSAKSHRHDSILYMFGQMGMGTVTQEGGIAINTEPHNDAPAALQVVGYLVNTDANSGSPTVKVKFSFRPRFYLDENATGLLMRLRGWSIIKHWVKEVALHVRTENSTTRYVIPGGPWKWDEPNGVYPLEWSLPVIDGVIEGMDVLLEEDPNAQIPTWVGNIWGIRNWAYFASVEFVAPLRTEYSGSTVAWDTDENNDKYLALKKPNSRAGLLSIAPFEARSVFVAASFVLASGPYPNSRGVTRYGLMFGADDTKDANIVMIEKDGQTNAKTIKLVRRRNSRDTVLYSANLGRLPGSLALRYEGGTLEVYEPGAQLSSLPGTLLFRYEWRYTDGPPLDAGLHVGVYGEIETPAVQVVGWVENYGPLQQKVLILPRATTLVQTGDVLSLPGGREFTVENIEDKGAYDGPFELRNIYNWPSRYSENGYSGWAVEFRKACWECTNEAAVYNRPVALSLGNYWEGRNVDFHPYITTNNQRNDLPGRIRYYSNDISGNEPVGLDTAVTLGGVYLVGRLIGREEYESYAAPPEIAEVKTTERIILTQFFAHELGRMHLQDAIRATAAVAGAHVKFVGDTTGSLGGTICL